jgi:hypothetical protein
LPQDLLLVGKQGIGKMANDAAQGSTGRSRCLLNPTRFNILKRLLRVENKVNDTVFAFTWHENSTEKAAQFCHFDF